MTSTATSPGFRSSRPGFHPAPATRSPPAEPEPETWEERAVGALPLFVVGVACLAVAVEFYTTGAVTSFGGNSSVLLRPWILFAALGVTGVAAGVVSLFLEDEAEPPRAVSAAAPARRPAVPAWDESLIEPEPRVPLRRRTWETELDSLDGGGVPSASSDAVLHQIEEIEASLRKKRQSPPPE